MNWIAENKTRIPAKRFVGPLTPQAQAVIAEFERELCEGFWQVNEEQADVPGGQPERQAARCTTSPQTCRAPLR